MDLYINQKLSEHKTHIISYATLKSILSEYNYENINNKIADLKQKNIIQTIKKGIYIHTPKFSNSLISKELLSNLLIESPSYISLDYALYYYGLIPETVYELTAITTARNKNYTTPLGVFSYKHIKQELFNIGLNIEIKKSYNFFIASKEKALCDKLYLTPNIAINSKADMFDFLENDLRINLDDIDNFECNIINEYLKYSNSKKIKLLLNVIQQL